MLKLYCVPESLYCAKTRILLRHKGLQWQELSPRDECHTESFSTIVPSGSLPTLVDDTFVISDSEAIAEYINEKWPQPPMLADDLQLRTKAREASRFHDTRLEPALRVLFPHAANPVSAIAVAAAQSRQISDRLREFAAMYVDPAALAGNNLTLGDCGYPITFAWIDAFIALLTLDISWPAAVTAYRHRIENIPAVAAELADYLPRVAAWVESKNPGANTNS